MEKVFFEELCKKLQIGKLIEEPRRLSGGFLHKMYSLSTDNGKYAVKLLNPFIMQRETAMENFRTAEYFEAILEEAGLPVLPAIVFGGKKMQVISGQYFYVFRWFSGKALQPCSITKEHVKCIGETLARIHRLESLVTGEKTDTVRINWAQYEEKLSIQEPEIGQLLEESLVFLEEMQSAANEAIKKLPAICAVCHNDMDPKNVLWDGAEYRVIDLECLGYGDPQIELIETALCWSGLDDCHVDTELFSAFLSAYAKAGGKIPEDLHAAYHANCGRLYWLEYCVQRALGTNCSAEEQDIGRDGIYTTLKQLHCVKDAWERISSAINLTENSDKQIEKTKPKTYWK